MAQIALKELTLKQLLKALPNIATGHDGVYIYNLELSDVDGKKVDMEKCWLKVDNGKCTWGEGHSDDDEATLFQVKKGGVDTLIAMQVFGLKAGMNAMMLGYITTNHIKKAEAWFKMFKTGKQSILDALKKEDIEITNANLDIYEELKLED